MLGQNPPRLSRGTTTVLDEFAALLARVEVLRAEATERHEAGQELQAAREAVRAAILEACKPTWGALVPHPLRQGAWSLLPSGAIEGKPPEPYDLARLLADRADQAIASSGNGELTRARAAALRVVAGMVKGLMSGGK